MWTPSWRYTVPAEKISACPRKLRSFTTEFRVEAAHRVIDSDRTIAEVAREGQRFSIRRMFRLLKVSTSGYYQHVKRRAATVVTPRQQRRADLEVKIADIHRESRGTYGSPRVTAQLRARGEMVTKKTVAHIMASAGLEGISPRTFTLTTTVVDDPPASFPPDLVERCFDQGRLDAAWYTGITYLTCGEGDMFLCAILNGHPRKVLGYSISNDIGADMVTAAIDRSVATRGGLCRDDPAFGSRWGIHGSSDCGVRSVRVESVGGYVRIMLGKKSV